MPGREIRSENLEGVTEGAVLSRGLGRSYGDSSLPPPGTLDVVGTTLADRILDFDLASGRLRAEAGLSLAELRRVFLPRGWFTPVSPGTQWVTLGGMVAADVHGKNHHRAGTIGRHVRSLRLRVADGRIVDCSREAERDLFLATLGGMGLTGHVLEVELDLERVPSSWILQETRPVENVDAFVEALQDAAPRWPFTVGWIDCLSRGGDRLGRGVLISGRWASPDEAPKEAPKERPRPSVPFTLPNAFMGPAVVRVFNETYFRVQSRMAGTRVVPASQFFYPLDAVGNWNRIYGSRGVTQYQCVLPAEAGPGAARRLLEVLTERGATSFLCVIKDCGDEGDGILSFPRPGISVALDIPIRDDTQELVDALNEHVVAERGRVYLAKDAFTRPEHFRAMEPRLGRFLEIRDRWDPDRRIRSAQSVRLFGDRP